ncbi:MAG: phosphatase [Anaerolineaceae bacterium]|nr:phosphatase [Anaerolineaceae bacterium]
MDELNQICNYLPIGPDLGTAGQPGPGQFAALRAAGYDLVVNLAMPTSTGALPDEPGLVAAQGMEYVAIPVVWEAPTLADLERFFDVMERARGRKVFVHCALNMRVSAFVFLYRVLRLGVPPDIARETMHRIWQPDGVWAAFVDDALARHGLAPALPDNA